MKKIRVLVVGMGNMGISHARAYAANPGFEIAGLCSRSIEQRHDVAQEFPGIPLFRNYAEALSELKPDAVSINTWHKEFLQTIHRNAIRIGTLIEDLLELEALEGGRSPALEREPVAVAPIVTSVLETTRGRAAEVGATVTAEVGPELVALGDADAVERIVLNLVDNALRPGGPAVRVAVTAEARADRLVLAVADSGPGVPAEHQARIFDRFHRGAAGRDPGRPGTGLGLAIARELATAMGGTLVLAGAARFTLELPRPPAPAA